MSEQEAQAELDQTALTAAHVAVEGVLIEFRDERISVLGPANGLVVKERDGTPSPVMRLGTRDALRIGITAYLAAERARHVPPSAENLEIVNGWLVERGAYPLDYPAGAAYGAQPYSDAEPLVRLSELSGWPVPVEATDEMVARGSKVLREWSSDPDEFGAMSQAVLEAALGGGE